MERDPNAVEEDGKPRKAVSEEALRSAWETYLGLDGVQEQRRVVASLSGKPLHLIEPDQVEITLDNSIQADTFEEIKSDLIPYLREQLQHFALRFKVKITERTQVLEPYTAQEKYQYLLNQNPALAEMRRRLDLDLES